MSRIPLRYLLVGGLLSVALFSLFVANLTANRIIAGIDRAQSSGIADLEAGAAVFALVTCICIIGFAMAVAAVIGSIVKTRVGDVRTATELIAAGTFDARTPDQPNDELGRLAASINEMALQLQRLDASRGDLLARISHELRTPLTVIMSAAFTLGRGETDERRASTLELIQHEADRTASMVTDLLTAASLQARGVVLQLSTEQAFDIVEQVVSRFQDSAAARGVHLEAVSTGEPVLIDCDRHRMHQVLGNLVSNAVRHAPPATTISIRLDVRKNRTAHITVCDAGPGIAPDAIDHIFEPFAQGDAAPGAMGLGLAIARDLIRMHDGDISVSSKPGDTRFAVSMPCHEHVTHTSQQARSRAVPSALAVPT